MKTPPLEPLQLLGNRLRSAGIPFALGGSGLLASLGLVDTVRDWDLTTDADWAEVEPLVRDLEYELLPPSGIYATSFLCRISHLGASIDLMGRFSIRTPSETYSVPTRITGEWKGIPVGCPAAWAKAYELMGRPEKAKLLKDFLSGRPLPK